MAQEKESHRPSSSSFRIQISARRCPLLAKVLQKSALQRRREEHRRRRSRNQLQSRRAIGMPDSGGATVFDDLPEWLVVADILVRLPVKDALRCRAVRKSWRSGTSTDAFILAHHRRQPSLPIVEDGKGICGVAGAFGCGGPKMRPVIRCPVLHALDRDLRFITCDGLVILQQQRSDYYICNPATRKWASLPHPPPRALEGYFSAVDVIGFYRHHPSGEHRALWVSYSIDTRSDLLTLGEVVLPDYSVLTVGSDQPRCIQWPTDREDGLPAVRPFHIPPIHLRANLHWLAGDDITVFHTVAETFRQMSHPAWPGAPVGNALMDIGGALALSGTTCDRVTLYVWVLHNYDAEIWSCQYRINLSAIPLLHIQHCAPRMAVINERELLIANDRVPLLHCDIDGVFLGNVESEEHELTLTKHRFQESMISLPLFEAQEEDALNREPPFLIMP